jgi:hypothetical protein
MARHIILKDAVDFMREVRALGQQRFGTDIFEGGTNVSAVRFVAQVKTAVNDAADRESEARAEAQQRLDLARAALDFAITEAFDAADASQRADERLDYMRVEYDLAARNAESLGIVDQVPFDSTDDVW